MNTTPFIDLKYIRILEHRVNNARFVQNNNFNCSCPICNEGSSPHKRRFYIGQASDGEFKYNCFNCGASGLLRNFLNNFHPDLYKQYTTEKFMEDKSDNLGTLVIKPDSKIQKLFDTPVFKAKSCKLVQDSQEAMDYLEYRKVPKEHHNKFVHVDDFQSFMKDIGYVRYEDLPEDSRLVLLLYNQDKKLIGVQGRAYANDAKIRYSTVRLGEDELAFIPKGIRFDCAIHVTEGAYDALMLPNAVANLSSSLDRMNKILNTNNLVLIYDNEPRAYAIMKQMKKSIDSRATVFIPDHRLPTKDLNEAVMRGFFDHKTLYEYVRSRTFVYPQSLMEFMKYCKLRNI